MNTALRILTRRDHSCAELKQKLSARGFEDQQIAAAVSECLRLAYLDDDRFTLSCLGSLRRRGYGVRRIRQVLKTKGVSGCLVENVIEKHYPLSEQFEDCDKVLKEKLERTATSPGRQKLYRFLLQRGFPVSIVADVIRAHRLSIEEYPPG